MDIKSTDTALVITDPQNDVLSEKGVAWALVGKSIAANRTVEHIGQLFKAAKANGYDASSHRTTTTQATRAGVRAARSRR